MATKDAHLIEDSPYDNYWGGKLPGSDNMLGIILMEYRDKILKGKDSKSKG